MTYTPKVIKAVGKEAQTFSLETVNLQYNSLNLCAKFAKIFQIIKQHYFKW